MSADINHRVVFAETCWSWAAAGRFPLRRDHLLVLARLSEQEAALVQQSYDRIAASKELIARTEILLDRR